MKKLLALLLALMMVFALSGCNIIEKIVSALPTETGGTVETADDSSSETEADAEPVFDAGDFEINLPEGYHLANEYIPEGSDITTIIADKYENIALSFIKEDKSLFEDSYVTSIEDYLDVQHSNTPDEDVSEVIDADGMKYFEYRFTDSDSGNTFQYFTTVAETADSYWTMQSFALVSEYDSLKDSFIRWFKSVKFK